MRARLTYIAIIAAAGFAAAVLGTSRSTLAVVVSVCRWNSELLTSSLPCLAIEDQGDERSGYAVIREPMSRRRMILTPLTALSGIEDPHLTSSKAHNFFADAWNERNRLLGGLSSVDPWRDIAIGINAQDNRSQDQLHIHIACIRPGVRAALIHHFGSDTSVRTQLRLRGRIYWAAFVISDSLQSINPIHFVSQNGLAHETDIGSLAIVVVGARASDGRRGFYILAGGRNGRDDAPASMERLLDPNCSLPRERLPGSDPDDGAP